MERSTRVISSSVRVLIPPLIGGSPCEFREVRKTDIVRSKKYRCVYPFPAVVILRNQEYRVSSGAEGGRKNPQTR
jgi:hypothetical protein